MGSDPYEVWDPDVSELDMSNKRRYVRGEIAVRELSEALKAAHADGRAAEASLAMPMEAMPALPAWPSAFAGAS